MEGGNAPWKSSSDLVAFKRRGRKDGSVHLGFTGNETAFVSEHGMLLNGSFVCYK